MSLFRFLSSKVGTGSVPTAGAHNVATTSHGAVAGHGHGHGAPWEGVNLWRTPFKGDTDTVTQVKRTKGVFDRYVENRVRRIQQLQLHALRNKSTATWVLLPRDRLMLAAKGTIAAYIIFYLGSTIYNHLKTKDRLKLAKLLYKDNVN